MESAFSSLKSIDYAVGNFIVGRFADIYMPKVSANRSINEFLQRSANSKLFYADVADPMDFRRQLRKAGRSATKLPAGVSSADSGSENVLFKQANLPAAWFYREPTISTPELSDVTPVADAERHSLDDESDLLISYDSVLLSYRLAFVAHDKDALDWMARIWLQRMRRADAGALNFKAKTTIGEMTGELTCSIQDKDGVMFSELPAPENARLYGLETTIEVAGELMMAECVPKKTTMRAELDKPRIDDPWTGE